VAAADGSLWAKTRLRDSLAHYRNGNWEVFRHDTFGPRNSTPRHDFAVVGNQLWAAIDDRLVHFDGQRWQSQPIPPAAADHVLAAGQQAVWVLGNDGILRTWRGEKWEAANLPGHDRRGSLGPREVVLRAALAGRGRRQPLAMLENRLARP
jgi:hypothetical protein